MCIAIVADDLTGACDCAVKMKDLVEDTQVILNLDVLSSPALPPRVFAVHTASRAVPGPESYQRVHSTTAGLKKIGVERFYKKVDSLLRGNNMYEIGAMLDALGSPLAILAPAVPNNNRKVMDGMLYIDGACNGYSLLEVLGAETGEQPAHIPLSTLRRGVPYILEAIEAHRAAGARVILFDSETQEDMDEIAGACRQLPHNFLPVGSSGFIESLQHYWGLDNPQPPVLTPPGRPGPLLYVVGTFHPVTRRQVNRLLGCAGSASAYLDVAACLSGGREGEIRRLLSAAQAQLAQDPQLLMLTMDSTPSETAEPEQGPGSGPREVSSAVLTDCLATVVQELLASGQVGGLLLTGGDTAQSVLEHLEISRLSLLGELLPGVVVSQAQVGEHPLCIITKSGGFGPDDALVTVRDFLLGNQPAEGCRIADKIG